MKLASLLRATALVSAVALIPATTAGLAAVDGRASAQFERLATVYQLVKIRYVEKVSDEKLEEGAIDGMLASLDPHSSYVSGASMQRLNTMKFSLALTEEAKDFVAEKGYDPQFGARPLHRAIQKYVEDPLAEFILSETPSEGTALVAAMNEVKDGLLVTYAEEIEDTDIQLALEAEN